MANIKTGWLKDNLGDKFAPKTLLSQVMTADGITLEDKISTDLDNALIEAKEYTDEKIASIPAVDAYTKSEVDEFLNDKADGNHNHDDVYETKTDAQTKLDEAKAYTDSAVDSLEQYIGDIGVGSTIVFDGEANDGDTGVHYDFYSALGAININTGVIEGSKYTVVFGEDTYENCEAVMSISDDCVVINTPEHIIRFYSPDNVMLSYTNGQSKYASHEFVRLTIYSEVNSVVDYIDMKTSSINTILDEAKAYTDEATNGLASTSSVTTAISTHNIATDAHNDIRDLITGLTTRLNTLADSDDTTLDQMSELVAYIKSNKELIDDITTTKVNVSDIIDNLTTNVANKPLSAAQGVAIKALIDGLQTAVDSKADDGHKHAISDVTNLQSTLDAKATQTSLDSHDSNTTKHITSTERTNWNYAKTHADSAHAPSNAQANVIESIKVNGTAQTISSKSVNITVPTDNASLTNGAGYLVASDIDNKADKASTLSGYGITNAYTITEVDAALSEKADKSHGNHVPTVQNADNSTFLRNDNTWQKVTPENIGAADAVHGHVISDIDNLQVTLNNAASAIIANTESINSHSTDISNLQAAIDEIEIDEITITDIQALFDI